MEPGGSPRLSRTPRALPSFASQRLPRGVPERPPCRGVPGTEYVGAPTGSSRRGQASRPARVPTAPSGGLAKEEASGPADAPRWALFPGALCSSRGPELFKPLELSSGLGVSGYGSALCLPESLS